MPDVLVRAGWAIGIAAAGLLLYWLWNRAQMRRLGKADRGLAGFIPGKMSILYFTTPDCVPCKTQQRPALHKLMDWGIDVQIIEIDATQQPYLADYWGVLSVPTTFIIDRNLQPRALNHGVANANKLRQQLKAADGGKAKPTVEDRAAKVLTEKVYNRNS
jgi:thioredoxin 1